MADNSVKARVWLNLLFAINCGSILTAVMFECAVRTSLGSHVLRKLQESIGFQQSSVTGARCLFFLLVGLFSGVVFIVLRFSGHLLDQWPTKDLLIGIVPVIGPTAYWFAVMRSLSGFPEIAFLVSTAGVTLIAAMDLANRRRFFGGVLAFWFCLWTYVLSRGEFDPVMLVIPISGFLLITVWRTLPSRPTLVFGYKC